MTFVFQFFGWRPALLGSCLGAASCCVSAPPAAPSPSSSTPAASAPAAAPVPDAPDVERPQLLVAVVIDQLGSDTLLRSLPALDEHGLIRTAISKGAFFERGVFPYINTFTAPGHAAIFTGAPPRTSGIGGNEDWDERVGAMVPLVHSPGHVVFGHESMTAGPTRLRQRTVAQMLEAQSPASKVVAVSLKDRAAVFSVGAGPDLAAWYEPALGRFTTSSFCVERVPEWLSRFQAESPPSAAIRPWVPRTPALYESLLGPDAGVGEDGPWGATFPHDPNTTDAPARMARLLPSLSEYLVALAERASVEYALGRDEAPDLLVISISGTDYVGHLFGPHSWEYLDHLRRADAALGRLIARLSSSIRTSVMITADHGVAPLPEHSQSAGHAAGRIFGQQIRAELEKLLDETVAPADWVSAIVSHFLYFTASAKQHPRYAEAVAAAQAYLSTVEGVQRVHTAGEAAAWARSDETEQRMVANSFPAGSRADLLIDTRPFWIFGYGPPPGAGTDHGSRQDYDRQVPLLFFGPGIAPYRQSQPVSQLSIAPTLCALLGVEPPPGATEPALDLPKP